MKFPKPIYMYYIHHVIIIREAVTWVAYLIKIKVRNNQQLITLSSSEDFILSTTVII